MHQILPSIREGFLGDVRAMFSAALGGGPVVSTSTSASETPVLSGPGPMHKTFAAVRFVPHRLVPVGILLVVMLWVSPLGQASVAGNLIEREKGPAPGNAVQSTSTNRGRSGFSVIDARFGGRSIHRPFKRHHGFPRLVRDDDPNDDDTSDDPNDVVVWDDRDDTVIPIIACLPERFRPLPPPETESALDSIIPPPSPFLTLQRLRC
jgi:hypothetical protein